MNYLKVTDLKPNIVEQIVQRALEFKAYASSNILKNKVVVLLFEKPSLRTKMSFMIGIQRLGGNAIYFSDQEVGLGVREPIRDIAGVVSSMADMVVIRTFEQEKVEKFAYYSSIPVINALTDTEHPCQALGDMLTIQEHIGGIRGKQLAFIGDGNNVARSLAYATAGLGGRFIIASPSGFELPHQVVEDANQYGKQSGGSVKQVRMPTTAVQGASIVYTDVWVSMGMQTNILARQEAFKSYQVNLDLMKQAPDALFMHDMPAHPGEEVTEDVLYSNFSICLQQANNRLWTQLALMEKLIQR